MRRIREVARQVRCIACGLVAPAQTDLLCVNCAREPEYTMTITDDLAKACRFDADQYWRDLLLATEAADDVLSQRWQRFMDAATLDPEKHAAAKRIARSGRTDPLMDLIRLYCQWEDAQAVCEERSAWAERVYAAIGELDTHTIV